jgi:DNA-binding transcriptional ArsR family regulator
MNRGLAPPALLAFALLAVAALPLAIADTDPEPWDTTGPSVGSITVDPNPVLPGVVTVRATATSLQTNVLSAEFWIDVPGADATSLFSMTPVDGMFGDPTEDLIRIDPYDTFTQGIAAPGLHYLFIHASDGVGAWGPYASFAFILSEPSTTGPIVTSLTATPVDLPLGADLVIEGLVVDPFGGAILAAEFFLDVQGPDGSGEALGPLDGSWGDRSEIVGITAPVSLAPGGHAIYVHAQNSRILWGAPARSAFTVRAPALSLRFTAESGATRPGEIVTSSVYIENHGNAIATEAWVAVFLPPALVYLDDTAAASGGTRTGAGGWRFTNVTAAGLEFAIQLQIRNDATDGMDLAAEATLDYTNDLGWDFESVAAIATVSVVAPELWLGLGAPAIVYAGEAFDLVIDLSQSGVRTIPAVEVRVDTGPWSTRVEDNAADLGGEFFGDGLWRFPALAPGSHRLVIKERTSTDAEDLGLSPQGVTVAYLSRFATPVTLYESVVPTVARPSLELEVRAGQLEVVAGERISLFVDYANRGSATARDVEIEGTLPDGVELVGGDAPTYSSGARHVWRFSDVAAGESGRVTLVVLAWKELAAMVRVELTYSSPNGALLASRVASATVAFQRVPLPLPMAAIAFAGTSLAFVALIATERGKTALTFLLFLPLYTRLRHEKILNHETRGMIRGYIVANPGDHYNSIKEALELPNGTLAYHIQVLQKEMIVRSVKDGKFRRFYPAEMRVPEGGEPTKIQRVILDLIRTNPGITPRDAAGLLGLSSSTVSYHLEKLEEHGRVEYRREGITKRLYVRGDLAGP